MDKQWRQERPQSYIVSSRTHIAESNRAKCVELAHRWGVPVIFRIHWKPQKGEQ